MTFLKICLLFALAAVYVGAIMADEITAEEEYVWKFTIVQVLQLTYLVLMEKKTIANWLLGYSNRVRQEIFLTKNQIVLDSRQFELRDNGDITAGDGAITAGDGADHGDGAVSTVVAGDFRMADTGEEVDILIWQWDAHRSSFYGQFSLY